jgi:hypothetical protein
MPVEIRELVIKAVVQDDGHHGNDPGVMGAQTELQQEMIIQACVEKILAILKDKQER